MFFEFSNRQNNINQYLRSCSTFFRGLVSQASIFCFPRNIKMPRLWKCSYWNTSFLYTCMPKCVTGLDFGGCSNPLFSKTTWFIFFVGVSLGRPLIDELSILKRLPKLPDRLSSWVSSTVVCLWGTHPLKSSGFCCFGIVILVKCWEVLILLTALDIQSHAFNTTCFAALKKASINNFSLRGISK